MRSNQTFRGAREPDLGRKMIKRNPFHLLSHQKGMKIPSMLQAGAPSIGLPRSEPSFSLHPVPLINQFNLQIGTGNHEISFEYENSSCSNFVSSYHILHALVNSFRKPNAHIAILTNSSAYKNSL
jgi:hypothetical protein